MQSNINYKNALYIAPKDNIKLLGENIYGVADERFFLIPDSKDYYLSTYGRLIKQAENGSLSLIGLAKDQVKEVYYVEYQDKEGKKAVSVSKLMKSVFFPYLSDVYTLKPLYTHHNLELRWDVKKLIAINNHNIISGNAVPSTKYYGDRTEGAELIIAKIEGRRPLLHPNAYSKSQEYLGNREISDFVKSRYVNICRRSRYASVKKARPQYTNVSICEEWMNNERSALNYLKSIYYEYPATRNAKGQLIPLEIDKDLFSLNSESLIYSPETTCFLPRYINGIFRRGEFKIEHKNRGFLVQNNYDLLTDYEKEYCFQEFAESLNFARKLRSQYIRRVVEKERQNGYMPEYILAQMLLWADECEKGNVKIWEPSDEVKSKYGLL